MRSVLPVVQSAREGWSTRAGSYWTEKQIPFGNDKPEKQAQEQKQILRFTQDDNSFD